MKKLFTALGIASTLLSTLPAEALFNYTVYAGYYSTHFVAARPIKFSQATPNKGYIFGISSHLIPLSSYITFNTGYSYARWTAGKNTAWVAAFVPSVRLWLYRNGFINPYAEVSVAPAYISAQHFADSNLGSHFVFQSSIGIGASIGQAHLFNVMARFYHYSNFGLFKKNSGLDIPFVVSLGYEF